MGLDSEAHIARHVLSIQPHSCFLKNNSIDLFPSQCVLNHKVYSFWKVFVLQAFCSIYYFSYSVENTSKNRKF